MGPGGYGVHDQYDEEAPMSEAPYPPAEPPADGDWTGQVPPPGTPRYSASASVPNPPANQPPDPYGSFGQPAGGQYGQPGPSPYGQPAPGSFGQPGPSPYGEPAPGGFGQPPAGSARVGASASVPPAGPPSNFGAPPQGF